MDGRADRQMDGQMDAELDQTAFQVFTGFPVSCQQKMFADETSAMVKNVGAEEKLISNSNLNQKVELLTLVRVSQGRFFSYPKYTPVDFTLPELLEDDNFSPGGIPDRHSSSTCSISVTFNLSARG